MIIGIGCDIEEIGSFRFIRDDTQWRDYSTRFGFTSRELDECKLKGSSRVGSLTGKWCAKEAVIKALSGLGEKITLKDVEVLDWLDGRPTVELSKNLKYQVKVSISHCSRYAMAVAIVEE